MQVGLLSLIRQNHVTSFAGRCLREPAACATEDLIVSEQAPPPRYPDPPTGWFKALIEKPKRSWRGFFLGVLVTVALAVLLPIIAYVAVLIYIKTGGVERAVKGAVKGSLGPNASVGEIETSGIESLRIGELNLPSNDGDTVPALHVKNVRVRWDPYALVMQKQVRAVDIEKPSLSLRRDANGRWNFERPPTKPSEYWVDEIQVSGGTLGLEWAPGRRLDLTGVRVMMTRARPPMPQPLTLYAQWPSKSELRVDAVIGPGSSLRAGVTGTVDLENDLGFIEWTGERPSGRLACRFDLLREWSMYSNTTGDWTFDGRVDCKDFRWKIGKDVALVIPDRRIELRARVSEPRLTAWPAVEEVVLEVSGLGALRGRIDFLTEGTETAVFEKGRLRLMIQDLSKWFEGLNLPNDWSKEGAVFLEDLQVSVPLGDPAGLVYQGRLDAPNLRLGIPGAGGLPPVRLKAHVSGSLKGATISGADVTFGEIGRLAFDAQARWRDLGAAWLELLKVVKVNAFELDLGALLRTELGRRLLGGRMGEGAVPTLGELPVVAQGRLSGRGMKTDVRQAGAATTVSLSGIHAADLEIQRSPLPVDLSGLKVSGDLGGEVTAVGAALHGLRLEGHLTHVGGAKMEGRFSLRMEAGSDGRMGLSGVGVPALSIPVDSLLRMLGLASGVRCAGHLMLTDGVYDAAAKSAAGLVRFEKLVAERAGVALSALSGQMRVTFKEGRLTAKGRIEPAQLVVLTQRIPVPAMELTLSATRGADGQWQEFAANLGWESGAHFSVSAVVTRPDRTTARVVGRLDTSFWGGLSGGYDVSADSLGFEIADWAKWQVGPLVLKLENFDLGRLGDSPLGAYIPPTLKLAGKLPRLSLEASPFSLGDLRTGRPGSAVVVTGETDQVHLRYSPTANEMERSEAARLTGTFRGEVAFDAGSTGITCNVLTTLKDYELLVDPRYLVFLGSFKPNERFYIPPPKRKEKLIAQFVAQIQPQKSGLLDVRVHKALLDMSPRLRLSAAGRMTVPGDWDVFGKGEGFLNDVELVSNDLNALNRDLLQQNIGRRAPDLKLSGAFTYAGRHIWSSDRSALSGKILFNQVSIANTGWTATGLTGELPLSFHQGLWPADWPTDLRGTMTWSAVDRPPLRIPQQPVAIIASPNVLRAVTPVKATVTGGEVQIEGLQIENILIGAPRIDFGFRVNALRFGDIAAAQSLDFKGLNGYAQYPPAVLTGLLSSCRLWREPSVLGTWNLITNGSLTAPFFQGNLQLSGLYIQDCLGLTPALGFRELKIDGLSIGSLTAHNSSHGQVKVDVNLSVTGFEMLGTGVSGIRKFRMEVGSIPKPDKEYFFERRFAQWLSKEPEEKVSVGKKPLFQHLGWAVELKPIAPEERRQNPTLRADDAWLYYLLPLLPNECILSGIRLEGVENSALTDGKRQVKGKSTERMLWSEVVTKWMKKE